MLLNLLRTIILSILKINFVSKYGIGDKIATIFSMENCGRQTGEKFEICGDLVSKEICDLFELGFVEFTTDTSGSIVSVDVRGKKSTDEYVKNGYIHYISRIKKYLEENHGYNSSLAVSLKPVNYIRTVGDYVVCQFDSRFAKCHTFGLSNQEINRIIKNHIAHEEKIFAIGGEETELYLNDLNNYDFCYKFGNFDYLLKIIMGCNRFVGVDSGMSHLAGVVGIPSEVYFLIPVWYARAGLNAVDGQNIPECKIIDGFNNDLNPSLVNYYSSYKNSICYGRENFQRKLF